MLYLDESRTLPIADVEQNPLADLSVTVEELERSYQHMILSASGWRKIFAASGDEEDAQRDISPVDRVLVALAAEAFYRTRKPETVILGMDSRPTGAAIADIMCRIFLAHEVAVKHVFITAAPEIMAYSAANHAYDFFYITASHNPIGHNGFKFGWEGGVAEPDIAAQIIATFRTLLTDPDTLPIIQHLSASVTPTAYRQVVNAIAEEKEKAQKAYRHLSVTIAANTHDDHAIQAYLRLLKANLSKHPVGIVGELNGSARCMSIDAAFLAELGVKTRFIHDQVGVITHGIVPEGTNLEQCRQALAQAHQEDSAFVLGYVPDNDGDRGNIVYFNEERNESIILEAQTLFGLIASIELTIASSSEQPQAIVVNGPTSLMIESIAKKRGVTVFRSEVGEAHVVQLAQKVRALGYTVRILGEGSNGGNITHPGKVRDPLNTLVSLVRLLSDPSLFRAVTSSTQKPSLRQALLALPNRTCTGSFSPEAMIRITSSDHGALKTAYEYYFATDYAERSEELSHQFGICGWREEQTEGTIMRVGVGNAYRRAPMRGGLKIVFSDAHGVDTDFIWMRGSGTEPVFRLMADALGHDTERHQYLLSWQRSLIERADRRVSQRESSNS